MKDKTIGLWYDIYTVHTYNSKIKWIDYSVIQCVCVCIRWGGEKEREEEVRENTKIPNMFTVLKHKI